MSGFARVGLGGLLALALAVLPGNGAAEERFALVRPWADLYVAPRADAPRLNPYAEAGGPPGGAEAVVHRLVGERDGWLELETVPSSAWGAHCVRGLRALETLRLRVYARADAAVSVTTRPVRLAWPDGTAVELAPGVPLFDRDGDRWRAGLGSVALDLALPADAVGGSYAPGEPFGRAARGVIFVDDAAVRAGALRLGSGRVLPTSGLPVPALFARETLSSGNDVVARFDLGCGRVTARIAAPSLRRLEAESPEPTAGRAAPPAGRLRVVAGATAHWPDGAVAGRADEEMAFHREVPSDHPHLRCLQRPLRHVRRGEQRIDPRNRLVLCFAPSAIAR